MNKTFLLFLVSCVAFPVMACFNQINVIRGVSYPNRLNGWELWKPTIDKTELRHFIDETRATCNGKALCSDVVIAYFYTGEFDKALELSTRLVKNYPSYYEVVMTHAAALELNGRFEEALRYIRRGMRIDPHSHKDSEWIHVKILEARIAGGTPATILGFDYGSGDEPDTPKGVANVRQLVDQLHFQLTERYIFISKHDPQFGALLHDYATVLYLANFKTISREYFDLAIAYGFDPDVKPNNASLPPLPNAEPEVQPWQERKLQQAPEATEASGSSHRLAVPLAFAGVVVLTLMARSIVRRRR